MSTQPPADPLDRAELRRLLELAANSLSNLAEQAIEAKLRSLPPGVRTVVSPLISELSGIRSTMSSASTALSEELSEDDLWALTHWLSQETARITGSTSARDPSREARDRAIAKVRDVLTR